jgi:hypothetical protein
VANYVKSTNFAVKDTLLTGNPAKLVKGTEIDTEFNAISSAIATKLDSTVASLTVTNITTDNLIVGNQANKATVVYTTNAARTLTIPAVSGNRTFAFINEAQTFTADQNITGNLTTSQTTTTNSLVVGTQSGKATVSYTTNAARTLTVPAVAGNRTFAFIDEAQTFSTNQTINANLAFTGNARRIQGLFSGVTAVADRTLFQTSSTDSGTAVAAIPNGTSQQCSFIVNNNSNPTNSTFTAIYVDDDECAINGGINGSGTYLPLRILNGGNPHIIIDPTGEVGMSTLPEADTTLKLAGRTHSLKADARVRFSGSYNYTVGATNRTLFIDNSGDIGGLSSTRESKTNITPIADTDWLMSLEPVSYNRRERNEDGTYADEYKANTEFGLIADDVANVRPEICVFVNGKVSGINYEQLISPMLKEIQNLRAELAAIKEKVNG